MEILEALAALDATNDEQWTADGLPKVDAVAELVGNPELKRSDIVEAAPEFTRQVAKENASDTTTNESQPSDPSQSPSESTNEAGEVEQSLEEKLADELTAAQLEMADITRAQATLNQERNILARKIGYIGGQLDKVRSQGPMDSGISHYIASQTALRLEKAERLQALKESGVAELLKSVGISKLDAAMNQRKPARGSQRPQRPFVQ